MGMAFGNKIRITLFGESHGQCVGALLEGCLLYTSDAADDP